VDDQQKQPILDLPKVIAVGIASPAVTILTSRFGVAGTVIGLAVGAMILTALVDFLKVYLARAPATVAKVPDTMVKMPGGLRTRLSWRNVRSRIQAAFAKVFSLTAAPPKRRRAILIGSLLAAGISFLVALSIVTALELGVGKSFSCWLWEDCPAAESSAEDDQPSTSAITLPSILGGGPSVPTSGAPAVQPPPAPPQQPNPALPQQPASKFSQQPSPRVPGVPSQPEGVQGSSQQPSSAQPDQQQSPIIAPEEGNQQSSPPERSQEVKQPSGPGEPQQQEDQRTQPSSDSDRQPTQESSPFPSVPWST
jgi:uncharacterized membrane protein YjjB (DUF3815 family)